jgi:hypothetical protein
VPRSLAGVPMAALALTPNSTCAVMASSGEVRCWGVLAPLVARGRSPASLGAAQDAALRRPLLDFTVTVGEPGADDSTCFTTRMCATLPVALSAVQTIASAAAIGRSIGIVGTVSTDAPLIIPASLPGLLLVGLTPDATIRFTFNASTAARCTAAGAVHMSTSCAIGLFTAADTASIMALTLEGSPGPGALAAAGANMPWCHRAVTMTGRYISMVDVTLRNWFCHDALIALPLATFSRALPLRTTGDATRLRRVAFSSAWARTFVTVTGHPCVELEDTSVAAAAPGAAFAVVAGVRGLCASLVWLWRISARSPRTGSSPRQQRQAQVPCTPTLLCAAAASPFMTPQPWPSTPLRSPT